MSSSPDHVASAAAAPFSPVGLELLLRIKLRGLVNRLSHAVAEAPVKFLATASCLGLVWLGLYVLFRLVFDNLKQARLESAVAIPMVFAFFFVAMLVMLAISNAILAYLSMFAVDEAAYLLTAPVAPRAYVGLKYIETLILSSWSLVLLGLPLMVALAGTHEEPWFYYPFFLAFFLFFVPIPAAGGLLMAWVLARFLSQRLRRRLIIAGCVAAAAATIWFVQTVPVVEDQPHLWMNSFLRRLKFVHWAILPSTWVSRGVEAAMQYRPAEAFAYLGVTVANALFLSLVAVRVVSRKFSVAFDRALSMRGGERRTSVEPRGGMCGLVFSYLPARQRLIATKDLRTFLRDPLQWTQLVILFGLMGLYLLNLPRFTGGISPLEGWGMIIPFLNFGAISFILATFTSRFVFPLVSLEGQQMWLIGLLPLSTGELLAAKFAFAMTVTVGVALSTTVLAVIVLKMPLAWASVQIVTMFAVCIGLCGLAVGLGARLPEFAQRNAARIANGFGGTVNLVASVVLVLTMLVGMAYLGIRNRQDGFGGPVTPTALLIAGGVTALGIATGIGALTLGARHLRRVDI